MTFLPRISDRGELAVALGCGLDDLERFIDPERQEAHYREMKIPKRGRASKGLFRTVYEVESSLRRVQRALTLLLTRDYPVPSHVHGFVAKRSIVTNATMHLNARVVLHADLQDFFPSITIDRVLGAFGHLGASQHIAADLARLCTLRDRLPQGASSSPFLANIVCRELDDELLTLSAGTNSVYTRYADDLVFSGDAPPAPEAIDAAVQRHGFKLGRPIRRQKRGGIQFVTGLNVSSSTRPRVPSTLKRRLRQTLHYIERYGLSDHLGRSGSTRSEGQAVARITGTIAFIQSVEPELGALLRDRWHKLLDSGR
jgi:hypothetical protein